MNSSIEGRAELNAILHELRDFDTALIANTLNYIDPTPTHEFYMAGSIQSVTPSLGPTVGVAMTTEIDTSTPGGKPEMDLFWKQLEQMQSIGSPIVWIVKAAGSRPDHECAIGDGMAKLLYSVGCLGVVTDGAVRDIPGLLATPMAAYCRGRIAHHGALRVRAVDRPIEVGGIRISPGDVIHANSEGVIKIPRDALKAMPPRLTKMRAAEHDTHRVWRRTDLSIAEKRAHAGEIFKQYGFGSTPGGHGHELSGGRQT